MNFSKMLLSGVKIFCLLLSLAATTSVISYNDDQNDCFVCEQYDRCEECYDNESGVEAYPYQANTYSRRYSPERREGRTDEWRARQRSEMMGSYR